MHSKLSVPLGIHFEFSPHGSSWHIFFLSHLFLVGFITKLALHSHSYEPTVFVQIAYAPQGLPASHSFTSSQLRPSPYSDWNIKFAKKKTTLVQYFENHPLNVFRQLLNSSALSIRNQINKLHGIRSDLSGSSKYL